MLKESNVNEKSLKVTYFIKSSVEKVYSAWTNPDQIVHWMGPGEVKCEKATTDLKIGGQYTINMRSAEGPHIALGEYKEIVPNEKLVFTWEWKDGSFKNSLVTVNFQAQDGGTLITLDHTLLPSKEAAEHHTQGWVGCITNLEKFLS